MLYFSEILGKKVITEDQVEAGKLTDLVFVFEDTPKITKLLIKDKNNHSFFVPVEFLVRINDRITLNKGFQTTEKIEQELLLAKNVLDKQIIDISGNKIVRVNDIMIQNNPYYYVAGVDISSLAIFRRLGLENALLKFHKLIGIKVSSHFLAWSDIQLLELSRGIVKLKTQLTKLQELPPEDLAEHLEKTTVQNIRRILKILDEKKAAQVASSLNTSSQAALFRHLYTEKVARLIVNMNSDEAVDALLTLPRKKREEVINLLPEKNKNKIEYLLNLAKTPIGNLITTEFLAIDPKTAVKEVIERIKRETSEFSFFTYVYVVNKNNQLVGVCNLHELLIQNLDTPIYKFMVQNLVIGYLSMPKEILLKKMIKYKLFAIPIVDKENHIIGIVTIDDCIDQSQNQL